MMEPSSSKWSLDSARSTKYFSSFEKLINKNDETFNFIDSNIHIMTIFDEAVYAFLIKLV